MELRGIVLGDRYSLEWRIATGGMGQVWLAADQALGRQVAVKLLRPEYAEHPQTLERFRSEARHAGVLSHPHIAQVYDYGFGSGPRSADGALACEEPSEPFLGPYLVMEYVDGPSLAELLDRAPLSTALTCRVLAQAAAGLDAAHRAGLVHRDVKPGNLLLTSDGRVKVTDFGVAHAAGSAPITAPGIVMGTSLYMAPERITGGLGTPACDLYSLGIVMYECLTGEPPFRGTSADVLAAHLHQALPPLPEQVPEPLRALVAKLTAKDPVYRLSDAGLLAARLRMLAPAGAAVADAEATSAGDPVLGEASPPGPDPARSPLSAAAIPPPPPWSTAERRVRAVMDDETRADLVLGFIPGERRPWGPRPGRRPGSIARRQSVAATVATVVVAAGGLAAAAGAFHSAPASSQGLADRPSRAAMRTATVTYVQVPAFHGRTVAAVIGWLRAHGLVPQIAWTRDHGGRPTGTVVSVTPDGPVPAGSTVIVTTAYTSATPPAITIPRSLRPAIPSGTTSSAARSPGSPSPRPAGSARATGTGSPGPAPTATSPGPTATSPVPTTHWSNPGGTTPAPKIPRA